MSTPIRSVSIQSKPSQIIVCTVLLLATLVTIQVYRFTELVLSPLRSLSLQVGETVKHVALQIREAYSPSLEGVS
jgi:hypothetical protein